jgi:hypothetical protein
VGLISGYRKINVIGLPIPDKGACSVLQPRGDALILIK